MGDDGVMLWRDNEYGTLEEDARRRDFTANAIFYDPVGERGIIDLVGGVQDLRDGVVRAIGDPGTRLDEDPVRLLRAVKLVAQYGFRAEPELERCLRARVAQIRQASATRLFEELLKVLSRPFAHRTFEALHEFGLLRHYWPNLADIWGTPHGQLPADLLAERDRRLAAGSSSGSKALALATIAFPAAAAALGCEHDPARLWEPGDGVDVECREAVRRFFQPFTVSRFFSARVRDILLLLPRFKDPASGNRLLRHPEYKYGRELFALLTTVCQWSGDTLSRWPPHDPALHGSPRRREQRPPHAHRRGHERRTGGHLPDGAGPER
jgi:poly(A) polymerase